MYLIFAHEYEQGDCICESFWSHLALVVEIHSIPKNKFTKKQDRSMSNNSFKNCICKFLAVKLKSGGQHLVGGEDRDIVQLKTPYKTSK